MAMSRFLMWLKSGQKPLPMPMLVGPWLLNSARRTTG